MTFRQLFAGALAAALLFSGAAIGQTCQGSITTASAPDSRYVDNGDGTVTDTRTLLMWKQCAEGLSGAGCATGTAGTYAWQQALARAQTVDGSGFAGHSDWRLPNREELWSLVEVKCYGPAINATLFPNTPGAFWSSSPYESATTKAWGVDFGYGYNVLYDKSSADYVRLVRGGP